jgi:hypothetical protein
MTETNSSTTPVNNHIWENNSNYSEISQLITYNYCRAKCMLVEIRVLQTYRNKLVLPQEKNY